ncbi:MAG: hypothetical protein D6732_05880 [Methanobacteriota archaeon]|nr:MAG: hypothetical protein D6732_05880 [Euryarchaeota archaeon]
MVLKSLKSTRILEDIFFPVSARGFMKAVIREDYKYDIRLFVAHRVIMDISVRTYQGILTNCSHKNSG